MKDWKIVSLENEKEDKQINRVFRHVWPKKVLKKKLGEKKLKSAYVLVKRVNKAFKNIDQKIITVYGCGQFHHYTYGLYKEAEGKFGKCCYWHFDQHSDWGYGSCDPDLDCGSFVNYLVGHSLSKCVRAIGNIKDPMGYNYKAFHSDRLTKDLTKKEIKKLIKGSSRKAYLSFDLDVMAEGEIQTNYGNDYLKTSELIKIIDMIKDNRKIISADILGYGGYDSKGEVFDPKSLVLYLIVAGKILGEDVKEFIKLHNYLKRPKEKIGMRKLLKCLG